MLSQGNAVSYFGNKNKMKHWIYCNNSDCFVVKMQKLKEQNKDSFQVHSPVILASNTTEV